MGIENWSSATETPKRTISTRHEMIEGKEIIVDWTPEITDRKENSFVGKIKGIGKDGSKWEGDAEIYTTAIDGVIKSYGIEKIIDRKMIEKSKTENTEVVAE